jgi:hypothetical protein
MSVQNEHSAVSFNTPPEIPNDLSRRGFLSGMGGLAAAMTAGALGLEPLAGLGGVAEAAEVGPLIGDPRLNAAVEVRQDAINRMIAGGIPDFHPCNGDETLYPAKIGSYSKGLPHDSFGVVTASAYQAMIDALSAGVPSDFELIPLGGTRKLVNPQSGLAFDTEGHDPHQFLIPNAPTFASAEEAAEAVELYWMALLRDVNFTSYSGNSLAVAAAQELSTLVDFKGPKVGGQVTTQTLFRDNLPGATTGPYISQFLIRPVPFGAENISRRIRTVVANSDRMVTFPNWKAVQDGNVPEPAPPFDETRRYIRNGRDIAQFVHVDVLFQAYFDACLILATPPDPTDTVTGGGIGAPPNPGNPYLGSATQEGFGTWGAPAFKTLMCEVATRALKAVWFQKWFVHRRLRPEAFGGRVHLRKTGQVGDPIHKQVLNSSALSRTFTKFNSYLLPQAFAEGSPLHPSYGAGHATVAGACVTMLKALFDGSFVVTNPVVPNSTGTGLVAAESPTLTVTGELNKLASNIATARNIAGVHWRSDAAESFKLGEAVAIQVLRDQKPLFNEGGSYIFQKFDGTTITI